MPVFHVSTRSRKGVSRTTPRAGRSSTNSSQSLAAWSIAAVTRTMMTAKRVRGPQSRDAGRPEFIRLSSPRKRGPIATGPSSDQIREIAPFQVVFFNELNFPIPIPFLQLFFPADGVLDPFICLHVYQPVDTIFAHECLCCSSLVRRSLVTPMYKVP